MQDVIKIYTDGGARGNPGPAASSFAVMLNGEVFFKDSLFLGIKTNNEAEYHAVLMAFNWLLKNKQKFINTEVQFFLDSELVVRQLLGFYRTKNQNLLVLSSKIKSIEKKLNMKISFQSIKREENTFADELVNLKLDEKN